MSNWSYFGGYALASHYLISSSSSNGNNGADDKVRRAATTLLAGSFAGVSYWLSCYPLDVLKARIQAAPDCVPPRYPTVASAAREIWVTSGYRGFFAGFTPCALRAMPANAAAFAGFELPCTAAWRQNKRGAPLSPAARAPRILEPSGI